MFVNTKTLFSHDECWMKIKIIKIIFNKDFKKQENVKRLVLMYVDNIVLVRTIFTKGCLFIYSKNHEIYGEIKMEICINEKSRKSIAIKLYVVRPMF